MLDIFTKTFLLVSAFFWIGGMSSYAPQEMFVQYSAFLALALSFWIPKVRTVKSGWISLIFGYLVLQTLIFNFDIMPRFTLVNVLLSVYLIQFFSERTMYPIKSIGKWFIGFATLNIFWMFLQHHNIDPIFVSSNPVAKPEVDIVGFFGGKFAMGCWAALALPFVFSVHPIFTVILLPLIFMSHSSTAAVGALFSFFFMMWMRNKRLALYLFGAFATLATLYVLKVDMPSGQFEKRFPVWLACITLSKEHWWFGAGLGMWKELGLMTTQETSKELLHWSWVHNEYLQFMFEAGFIGLILLLGYIYNSMKFLIRFLKFDKELQAIMASFISLILISLVHFPFHIGRLAALSVFILALVEAKKSDIKNSLPKKEEITHETSCTTGNSRTRIHTDWLAV